MIFPAGLSFNYNNMTLEEMDQYTRDWDLERKQIQKGTFIGSSILVHTPRMQILYAPYSHGVLIQGGTPKGTILIGLALSSSHMTFQNKEFDKHELLFLKYGEEIDFTSTQFSQLITLAIEESLFYEKYDSFFGLDFSTHQKEKITYIRYSLLEPLVQNIKKWLTYLQQDHNTLKINEHYDEIENNILTDIFSSIYLDRKSKQRQKFNISEVRTFLHQSIEENYTIADIARHYKISERLLFDAFKNKYGISPKSYFTSLRLNKIKEELLHLEQETSINALISRYKFYNQSSFAQSYKNMFGELPSETLHRNK